MTEELKSKLLAWANEWGSHISSQAEISFRRLLGLGLTVEEKANTVVQRFHDRVTDEPALAMEIAEVLRDQIEECAILIDNKAREWERLIKTNKDFIGTYEQIELFQEIAGEIRQMKILHKTGEK
jgi:hypothetical protein